MFSSSPRRLDPRDRTQELEGLDWRRKDPPREVEHALKLQTAARKAAEGHVHEMEMFLHFREKEIEEEVLCDTHGVEGTVASNVVQGVCQIEVGGADGPVLVPKTRR